MTIGRLEELIACLEDISYYKNEKIYRNDGSVDVKYCVDELRIWLNAYKNDILRDVEI